MKHAEVWDDSALIRSWNDTLEEYNRYHSIHAKGERVEDAIKAVEGSEDMEDGEIHPGGAPERDPDESLEVEPVPADMESGEEEEDEANKAVIHDTAQEEASTSAHPLKQQPNAQASAPLPSLAALSQQLGVSGQDEGLKNLLMSWYYAGYYTGLYEGQQRATQMQGSSSEQPQPDANAG